MTFPIQRKGDPNDGGGVVDTVPQDSVFVNDKLVAVHGSKGTGHGDEKGDHPYHTWQTVANSTVEIANRQVNKDTDVDTCGHIRVSGSGNVEIG